MHQLTWYNVQQKLAAASGVSVDDVLSSWAGGESVATSAPKEEAPVEEAPKEQVVEEETVEERSSC